MAPPKGITSLPLPPHLKPSRKALFDKWRAVDWSRQDVELADKTGLSPERIRQIRHNIGAPRAPHHGRSRQSLRTLQWAKDNLHLLKGRSRQELRREYGLACSRRSALTRLLKPFLRNGCLDTLHPWGRMNFALSSRDLERIWRLPYNIASTYRWRKQRPRPRWSFVGKHPRFGGRKELRAYRRAVAAEERKAAKYFASASPRPTALTHARRRAVLYSR